jgi:hypothetical protein
MPLPLDEIRSVIADAVAPRHFFIGNGLELEWEHAPAENIPWEIYKGRLLDASQTRERRTFEAWNIYSIDEFGRSTEPLLSVKLDAEAGEIHVVRAILCYAWEAYESSANVIESRETTKWVRELVGTLDLPNLHSVKPVSGRLGETLFRAVIGTSRLPLTSVEAPLPAFSLGRLAYLSRFQLPSAEAGPIGSWRNLVTLMPIGTTSVPTLEHTKHLETLLYVVPSANISEAADAWFKSLLRIAEERLADVKARVKIKLGGAFDENDPAVKAMLAVPPLGLSLGIQLLHGVFNETSLTPYMGLAEKITAWVLALESQGHFKAAHAVDFLGHTLRKLARHLTAYDLVVFHHRGANYPDALVLDVMIKSYLALIERDPTLFTDDPNDDEYVTKAKRLRRRALRQGWLTRRRYEGHLVPDAPTSPGENACVLPPLFVRVPEEQILNPAVRTKRLYAGDPLDRHLGGRAALVLQESIKDLAHPYEMRELGTAIFVDRPFGVRMDRTEPDNTPLFSYLAFSHSIARERLRYLADDLGLIPDHGRRNKHVQAMEDLQVPGIPVKDLIGEWPRGVVSLADALRAAEDFKVLRNTGTSWHEFHVRYLRLTAIFRIGLEDLYDAFRRGTIVRLAFPARGHKGLSIYDEQLRKRFELDFDSPSKSVSQAGFEYPILRVSRVWEAPGERKVVQGKVVFVGRDEPLIERDLSSDPILLQPERW